MIYEKYLPGSIYANTVASGISQLLAYPVAGWLYSKIGIKWSFTTLFGISVVGGVCILFLGTDASDIAMSVFVIIAMFGCSGGFAIAYVSTNDIFPALFCSTAIGICNVSSRTLTVASDLVAEMEPPTPMILFSTICAGVIILIQFVKTKEQQEQIKLKELEQKLHSESNTIY